MTKKKIFFLSQLYPYPAVSGGRIKTLNTLLTLAGAHRVYAVFISEEAPREQHIRFLTSKGIRVKVFHSPGVLASVKDDLWGLFRKFIRGIPHYVFQYTYGPAFPYIKRAIHEFQPDIIHVDHLNMAQYLPKIKREIWILEHHNIEAYLYWTRFIHTRKLTRKIYLFIEMALTYLYEKKTIRKFDHVFTISNPERDRLRMIFGPHSVSVQPLVYPPVVIKKTKAQHPYILFIGVLGWPPNEDAVEWFTKDIYPIVCKDIPDAEFHIVGQPGIRYAPLTRNGIILHGFRKDLTPFLARADVFVLPFRMGGGLRIKALTALSGGIPAVSTPLGVEGLNVRHGKECLIAISSHEFAFSLLRTLFDQRLRERLSRNALRYVRTHHSAKNNKEFLNQYESTVRHQ